ncbi:TetR/AcrR family transcriptional regulator [Enterococcus faecalis]|uniref:TetR/AcrR family transcriptional regulator n=1 Tax=Enterococcus faecalis TaxID=1351 RepID=UPI0040416B49
MRGKYEKQKKDILFYRTKERIITAITELLKVKSFDQVTVKDICKKATISRSGFYLHYMNKYDLVEKYQLELITNINQLIEENSKENLSMEKTLIKLLYFLKDEGQLLGLLISKKESVEIQNQVKKVLQQNALKNVIPHISFPLENEIEKHYLVIFFSNAMLGTLQEWINTEQKEDHEELVQILNKFIPYKLI